MKPQCMQQNEKDDEREIVSIPTEKTVHLVQGE